MRRRSWRSKRPSWPKCAKSCRELVLVVVKVPALAQMAVTCRTRKKESFLPMAGHQTDSSSCLRSNLLRRTSSVRTMRKKYSPIIHSNSPSPTTATLAPLCSLCGHVDYSELWSFYFDRARVFSRVCAESMNSNSVLRRAQTHPRASLQHTGSISQFSIGRPGPWQTRETYQIQRTANALFLSFVHRAATAICSLAKSASETSSRTMAMAATGVASTVTKTATRITTAATLMVSDRNPVLFPSNQ